MMLNSLYRTAAVAALASLPFSASALEFTVTQFSSSQLGDGTGAGSSDSRTDYKETRDSTFATIFATEDFEGFDDLGQIGETATVTKNGSEVPVSLSTAVGSFTTLGGKGSGSTAVDVSNVKGDDSKRGLNLSIRQDGDDPANGGRQNTSFTSSADDTYLDSNDTLGFEWVAGTAGSDAFDRLLFTLTDPSDVGKTLTISADGHSETHTILPRQPNGEIFNVLIGFSTGVSSATISLAKTGTNDGFSIDNVTVGAVPLPAAAWLLLGVSGALVGAKRRSARNAA